MNIIGSKKIIALMISLMAVILQSVMAQTATRPDQPGADANKRIIAPLQFDPLRSFAAYAKWRSDLTPDQARIGFEMLNSGGDHASALTLIRQTRDSVDFLVMKDFQVFQNDTATPLSIAAAAGNPEIVAALLSKGIPVDSVHTVGGHKGDTALSLAVNGASSAYRYYKSAASQNNYLETIKILLEAGADIEAKESEHGFTPLSIAIWHSPFVPADPADTEYYLAIVKMLLDHGANPAAVPSHFLSGNDDVALLLLNHTPSEKRDYSVLLANAAVNHKSAEVKQLLAQGANPNALMPGRSGPVISYADAESVMVLLKAGANPNACSEEISPGKCRVGGQPLIFWAPRNAELLHVLISNGANPNTEDAQGQTVLGYTLTYKIGTDYTKICIGTPGNATCMNAPGEKIDRAAAVSILLHAGADPNKRSRGVLPLELADDSDHGIINMLLDEGARMESVTIEGVRVGPISQAIISRKNFLAGEMLRRAGTTLPDDERWALFSAAATNNLELAKSLVQHGMNVNVKGPLGETALHYAAQERNEAMARLLLALGANANVQTERMPLLVPPEINNVIVPRPRASMMLKAKIYNALRLELPNLPDGNMTPLMLAVGSRNVGTIKVLLAGGAKTEIKSQQGLTALDIAKSMGDQEVESLLTNP